MPGGNLPKARALFANPGLGATYARILAESEAAGGSRERQIEAARRSWSQGFVAEAIDRFCRTQEVMDSSGRRHKGLLTGQDMASWSATYEKPASVTYHGWEVFKTGFWGQGPIFLQTLKLLEGFDLTGMDRFFGCFKLAHQLRQRIIQESGLNISMGLSQNKTVSKIATGEAKPNNEKQILLGEEKSFLSPLSVRKIPMIGEKTSQTLYNMGVKKVHTLQQMPAQLLEATFGKNGKMIWEKANGIDLSPVVPYTEAKSISSENTFEEDTIDTKLLEATLIAMTEQLSTKLRQKGQLTACVTVKIRYSDFETHSIQQRIPYTAADHSLLPLVKQLFQKLYTRRLLIRLVGVRFSNLVYGNYQIQLFEDSQQQIQLYQALDKLNVKYGDKTVCRAMTMGIGRRRFNPFNGMEN
jgi:DNA polymerase-4